MPAATPHSAHRPLRVALVGECMVEMQAGLDGAVHQSFGGDTLNTAVYLSRLGEGGTLAVDYVSAVGVDAFSQAMRALWHAEGVGDQHVCALSDALPGLYCIQTDAAGERSFTYWRGQSAARRMFEGPQADHMLEALAGYDAVYTSGISLAILGEQGRARLLKALAYARQVGARIVFDNNYRPHLWGAVLATRQAYREMLQLTDIAIVTWDDDAALFAYREPEALFADYAELGVREVVLKRGAADCLVQSAYGRSRVAAEPAVQVVDTTAAGDAFSAAYLACRLQGDHPEQSARWGHRLAAQVIGHRGALIPRAAMPVMGKVA